MTVSPECEQSLHSLLTEILQSSCELLRAADGAIGLVDEARGVIRTEAIFNLPEREYGVERTAGWGLFGVVFKTGEVANYAHYGDVPGASLKSRLDNAVIGVPIKWQGRLIGAFGLGSPPPRRFSDDDARVLQLFANHAAITIWKTQQFHILKQQSERFALLTGVARAVASSLDLDIVLKSAADAMQLTLGYANVAIPVVARSNPNVMEIRACAGPAYQSIAASEFRLPVSVGICGRAIRQGRAQLVNDVRMDADYFPTPGARAIRAALVVPIKLSGQVLGAISVEGATPFDADDVSCISVVASHLGVAIHNAVLYRSARRLSRLKERQRLRMDLHDSTAQLLASLNLMAQALTTTLQNSPIDGLQYAERIGELSRQALSEVRALVSEMAPVEVELTGCDTPTKVAPYVRILDHQGLGEALRTLATQIWHNRTSIALDVEPITKLDQPRAVALFRVAQEALSNALKHADASTVTLRLNQTSSSVNLEIEDDGIGVSKPSPRRPRTKRAGHGLKNMRSRMARLGGELALRTTATGGTLVRATLHSQLLEGTTE